MDDSDNMRRINLDTGQPRVNHPKKGTKGDPYTSEIAEAQKMIEELQRKKEAQEQAAQYQMQVEGRRVEFLEFKETILEKLSNVLPNIDVELQNSKQDITDLEQAKKHFLQSVKAVDSLNPQSWKADDVLTMSDKYQPLLAKVAREYDQFVAIQKESGRGKPMQNFSQKALIPAGRFTGDILRGLAFSLPLILTLVTLFILSRG